MPDTNKGKKIKLAMRKFYGKKTGDRVYYSSINKGRLIGTHRKNSRLEHQAQQARLRKGHKVFKNKYKHSPKHRKAISRGLKRYHRNK